VKRRVSWRQAKAQNWGCSAKEKKSQILRKRENKKQAKIPKILKLKTKSKRLLRNILTNEVKQ
jgi:hypothetical protein